MSNKTQFMVCLINNKGYYMYNILIRIHGRF